jgi:hypothetical protein
MKTRMITAVLGVITLGHLHAEPPDPLDIHRHVVDVLQSVHDSFPEPLKKFTEAFPPIAFPREGMIRLAQIEPSATGTDVFVDGAGIADWANNVAAFTTERTLDALFPRSAPRRPIMIGGDTKAHAALEEDLTVMMRILEKAAGGKDESKPTAAGVELFSFGKSSSPRMFYIDGYGAMFLLNVKYPLLAPPKKDESAQTNEQANSEWERAREEIYGTRRSDRVKFSPAPAEEFDPQRVENLKQQLIGDLANARNIRHLKPDDYVTVVVLGGGTRGGVMRWENRTPAGARAGSHASMEVRSTNGEPAPQTTMTLRVKKSDIDALAKGKLNEEEFRKKVLVQVY